MAENTIYNVASFGTISDMQALISTGVDINKSKNDGSTPLYIASAYGNVGIVQVLIAAGADLNKAKNDGATPIFEASQNRHLEVVNALIAAGADVNKARNDGITPIYAASEYAHLQVVKALIAAGADVNIPRDNKATPIYIASQYGHIQIVKTLIAAGADVNKARNDGSTPLIVSSYGRRVEITQALIAAGADVNKAKNDGVTPLFVWSESGNLKLVEALIAAGADITLGNVLQYARDGKFKPEINKLILSKVTEIPSVPYTGKSKSDIEFFNIFLGKVDETTSEGDMKNMIRNATFCPVCLANTIRVDGCLYMHHKCKDSARNEQLYNKYKNTEGDIWWCVDCGRICGGHRHYKLGLANAEKPELQPAGEAFARACDGSDGSRTNGGGSTTEKLKRIARMLDYAFELQHFVGEISEKEARDELIEETWNGALLRMRFDPLKFKRWKTDLSVFKDITPSASVVPEAIPQAGDIDTPTVDTGSDFITLEDGVPVIQFKHKNKDGVMFNHIHGDDDKRFIGKVGLITFMNTMGEKLGKCFDDDCGGWLWPQEIEMAFNDPKLKDSVTDEDRKVLAAYKERFNAAKAPKTGGAQWKFNFISEMEDGQCYLPSRKKAGNRTRKNKKQARKTMCRK